MQRATLGSALFKLSYPPFCSLFVSLPCCFRGISCMLPIRLISIVNNRCGAPGNPPPLLVGCEGFWLFVMRFNPYPPTGSQATLSKTRSKVLCVPCFKGSFISIVAPVGLIRLCFYLWVSACGEM